jgi:hypothetical protein
MAAFAFQSADKTDPTNQSCTIQQGSSFYFDYHPVDGTGTPVDTTNYSFAGAFKSAFGKDDVSDYDGRTVFSFSAAAGNVVNDPTNNRFVVLWSEDLTGNVRFKGESLSGVYDFYLTCPDGTRIRALWGSFTLSREVTTP